LEQGQVNLTDRERNLDYLRSNIDALIGVFDDRIEVTQKNKAEKVRLDSAIYETEQTVEKLNTSCLTLTTQISATKSYLKLKRKRAVDDINQAISDTLNLVSNPLPLFLDLKDKGDTKTCALFTMHPKLQEPIEYRRVEGNGLRAGISLRIWLSILQNTGSVQFVWLDELLSMMNAKTSAIFSEILEYLGQFFLIVLIEQKKEVFSNCKAIRYEVSKVGKTSIVTRIEG